jgi:hypothetical protein
VGAAPGTSKWPKSFANTPTHSAARMSSARGDPTFSPNEMIRALASPEAADVSMSHVASFRPLRLQSNRRITDPDSVPWIAMSASPCSAATGCCATTNRQREDARMHRTAVKSDRSGRSSDHQSDIGNWKRILDRLVYFVRLSGVPPALIQREFGSSIHRNRSIRQARVPPTHQLAYPDIYIVLVSLQACRDVLRKHSRQGPRPHSPCAPIRLHREVRSALFASVRSVLSQECRLIPGITP